MICRGALVYLLPLFPVTAIGVMKSGGVMLFVYRVRFNFRRLRRVLLNADPVFR